MKIFFSALSVIATSVGYLSLTVSAYAQNICPKGEFASLCTLRLDSGSTLVGRIVTILLILAVILALFFLIWGAIRWITSGGDKGKVDSARGTIVAAVIGLILALLAYFILNTIIFLFTKNTITNFTIPTIVP